MIMYIIMSWLAQALAGVIGLILPHVLPGRELIIVADFPSVTLARYITPDPETEEIEDIVFTREDLLRFPVGYIEFRAWFVLDRVKPESAIDVTHFVQWSAEDYYKNNDPQTYVFVGNSLDFLRQWERKGKAQIRVQARLGEFVADANIVAPMTVDDARALLERRLRELDPAAPPLEPQAEPAAEAPAPAKTLKGKVKDLLNKLSSAGHSFGALRTLTKKLSYYDERAKPGVVLPGSGAAYLSSESVVFGFGTWASGSTVFNKTNADLIARRGFLLNGLPSQQLEALLNELWHAMVDYRHVRLPSIGDVYEFKDADGKLFPLFKIPGFPNPLPRDRNGNGTLDPDEFPADYDNGAIDKNGDGEISDEELADHFEEKIDEALSQQLSEFAYWVASIMLKLDATPELTPSCINQLRSWLSLVKKFIRSMYRIFRAEIVTQWLDAIGLTDRGGDNIPDDIEDLFRRRGLDPDNNLNPLPAPPDGGGGGPDIVNPENPEPGDLPGQNPPTAPGDPQLPEPSTPPLALFLGTVICV